VLSAAPLGSIGDVQATATGEAPEPPPQAPTSNAHSAASPMKTIRLNMSRSFVDSVLRPYRPKPPCSEKAGSESMEEDVNR
jgi:hypothetical protein